MVPGQFGNLRFQFALTPGVFSQHDNKRLQIAGGYGEANLSGQCCWECRNAFNLCWRIFRSDGVHTFGHLCGVLEQIPRTTARATSAERGLFIRSRDREYGVRDLTLHECAHELFLRIGHSEIVSWQFNPSQQEKCR